MELSVAAESWPIRGEFATSRGSKRNARVVVATIRDGEYVGRGECVPYARYGETPESVQGQINSAYAAIEKGIDRRELQKLLPAGAARNALDCALWDLETKRQRKTIWELVGIQNPKPKQISFTIGLDTPSVMAEEARLAADRFALLKIKLGADGDEDRLREIRKAVPDSRIIVDANEGWTEKNIEAMIRACESAGVELIEQPIPAQYSNILQNIGISVPICADESAHISEDIPKLAGTYSAVNIKLDKTGGLTEAFAMAQKAKEAGLFIMVGCHVSTSLSMAPATVVAQMADYIDLDAPLLLEHDREPGIVYHDGMIFPTNPALWG